MGLKEFLQTIGGTFGNVGESLTKYGMQNQLYDKRDARNFEQQKELIKLRSSLRPRGGGGGGSSFNKRDLMSMLNKFSGIDAKTQDPNLNLDLSGIDLDTLNSPGDFAAFATQKNPILYQTFKGEQLEGVLEGIRNNALSQATINTGSDEASLGGLLKDMFTSNTLKGPLPPQSLTLKQRPGTFTPGQAQQQKQNLMQFISGGKLPPLVAPPPGGGQELKVLDGNTAAQILQEAGGDKNKARLIAKQRGYRF
jgi:hypothetical protein